jgi:hypothetical protein
MNDRQYWNKRLDEAYAKRPRTAEEFADEQVREMLHAIHQRYDADKVTKSLAARLQGLRAAQY